MELSRKRVNMNQTLTTKVQIMENKRFAFNVEIEENLYVKSGVIP